MKVLEYKQWIKTKDSRKEKILKREEINKINYVCIIENINKIKFDSLKILKKINNPMAKQIKKKERNTSYQY